MSTPSLHSSEQDTKEKGHVSQNEYYQEKVVAAVSAEEERRIVRKIDFKVRPRSLTTLCLRN